MLCGLGEECTKIRKQKRKKEKKLQPAKSVGRDRMLFVLLRPILCEKWKIAPPHSKTAPPQTSEFAKLHEIAASILVKTFFFFFLEIT